MSKSKALKIPGLGRIGAFHEPSGEGVGLVGQTGFETNLTAVVIRDGKPVPARELMSRWDRFKSNIRGNALEINLGSGLVTNVGVLALANDWNLAAPSGAAINTLKLANWHATGTGTTAAATTDIKLQTADGITSVAGTQSIISAANLQKYQTVATIAYTGTEAVTEWGLHTNGTLSVSTGSPVTAGSATTATVTGTPLTASSSTVQGQQQTILHDTGNATPMWGLVTSNTTSVVTVPAWYKVSDGTAAGTTPANTDTMVFRPVMWDHKVFSAINVLSGDSIQFTYTLTVTSGG